MHQQRKVTRHLLLNSSTRHHLHVQHECQELQWQLKEIAEKEGFSPHLIFGVHSKGRADSWGAEQLKEHRPSRCPIFHIILPI